MFLFNIYFSERQSATSFFALLSEKSRNPDFGSSNCFL